MTSLRLGAILVGLGLGLVLLGLIWLPAPPTSLGPVQFSPPSLRHPLGTDWFGRDILSRVMVGGRVSWAVAAIAVGVGGTAGIILGAIAGHAGGIVGEALMRVPDLLLAFPAVLVALLLSTVLGPGLLGVTLAISLFTLPYFARLTHSSVLALREEEFVVAARAAGCSSGRIVLRHILPNLSSPLLVQASVSLGSAFLAEAALSYLGLGTQPPDPAWGRMLREAQTYVGLSPWPAVFPGLILGLTVLGLNLLGDGLRDLADPLTRRLIPWRRP
ncbi:MAG: ABC transporter permease [Candidatus Bipolaricaulis anaerobius]|nr:ABC transporter permease [Candidatus Bipolaricaulis sp.]MDD3748496.1 ABC transporter permease [Candidatus Bipolaricaulis anaerobius]MDD5764400.1 ABC transporter permease [Candidatus Bipolaricaulis anaerobius]